VAGSGDHVSAARSRDRSAGLLIDYKSRWSSRRSSISLSGSDSTFFDRPAEAFQRHDLGKFRVATSGRRPGVMLYANLPGKGSPLRVAWNSIRTERE